MKKAIFAPESSREFQKRLNDLINAAENLNNKPMENEALKRLKNAQKELELAEKALGKLEIPEYIRILDLTSQHYDPNGCNIHKVYRSWDNLSGNRCYDIDDNCNSCMRFVTFDNCVPSTKEAFDKQNEIILVPDCIKFENIYKGLGIVFNDNKQTLWLQSDFYSVARSHKIHIKDGSNFKLTKCERSDLKAGDVAFRLDQDTIETCKNYNWYKDLSNYCVVLSDNAVPFINFKKEIRIDGSYYDHWYKVEKI